MEENLDELTVDELKDRLRDERLKVTGSKQELIDRLKERYTSMPEGSEYTAPAHVTVKQPDGSRKPIRTHDMEDAVKMLGFYYSLDAGKSQHVKEMVKKGVDWVDKMNTRKVPCRDAWMSFFAQLLPGINWGMVAVVLSPEILQESYQSLYYKMLPLLGVNRNIGKEWRMLPERYQGLGLPDFEVHSFSQKFHFLQRKWGGGDATSKMTETTYESFMTEVGVYGNIFSKP